MSIHYEQELETAFRTASQARQAALRGGVSDQVLGSAFLNQGVMTLLESAPTREVAVALEAVATEVRSGRYGGREEAPGPLGRKHPGLLILDDLFPSKLSGFRLAEYNHYLERFPEARVLSTGGSLHLISEPRPLVELIEEHAQDHPHLRARVLRGSAAPAAGAELGYTMFLNNVFIFLEYFETTETPFVFTLYPGGGFNLDDPETERKLRRVFASPMFTRVIATQRVTLDYLTRKRLCPPEAIAFVFGCVAMPPTAEPPARRRFGYEKDTLDICFMSHKYTPEGREKGWDVFLAVAERLSADERIRFHVAGGFGREDAPEAPWVERIAFQGGVPSDRLPAYFADKDLILSLNAPGGLGSGSFDGFPTGCCMEAALQGVAVMCTDPLGLNMAFSPDEELAIVGRDPDEVAGAIAAYLDAPERLDAMARAGREAFEATYSVARQLAPREALLRELGATRTR